MDVLTAVTLLLGVGILAANLRRPRFDAPRGNRAAGIIGGILVMAAGVGIGALAQSLNESRQIEAENERARQAVTAAVAPPEEAAAEPAPEPVVSEPVSEPEPTPEPVVASTTATPEADIANIAAIDGISADDPALTSAYSRLQELCPPENASIGDMAATMQRLVRERGGRSMSLVEIMRQLAIAQEGGQSAGMKCSETGGMLTELLMPQARDGLAVVVQLSGVLNAQHHLVLGHARLAGLPVRGQHFVPADLFVGQEAIGSSGFCPAGACVGDAG